ncbi:MAG: hypothetical protein IJ272_01810 [Clostridia bacterium]|nr:hypothetical protein [Clostridia bacterium]
MITNMITTVINNLKKYYNEDGLYIAYKAGEKPETDFERYCIDHCQDVESLVRAYERLQKDNENLRETIKSDDKVILSLCDEIKRLKSLR